MKLHSTAAVLALALSSPAFAEAPAATSTAVPAATSTAAAPAKEAKQTKLAHKKHVQKKVTKEQSEAKPVAK